MLENIQGKTFVTCNSIKTFYISILPSKQKDKLKIVGIGLFH